MALTDDEKKEILRLRGSQYSHGKIADKTSHSETTIRKVINGAKGRVIRLRAEGLQAQQIASQLDYPLAFVSNVIDEQERASGAAPGVDVEVSHPSKQIDVQAAWVSYKMQEGVERAKERLLDEGDKQIEDLRRLENQLQKKASLDADWRERKTTLEDRWAEFVLERVDGVDSQETLLALQSVVEEILENARALSEDGERKVREAEERSRQQEKQRSDQLLDKQIDIPLFPDFVKEQVKMLLLARTDEHAKAVADAMHQWALVIDRIRQASPEHRQQMWRLFVDRVREERWEYIQRSGKEYRHDLENSLLSIGICHRCHSRLTPRYYPGRVAMHCTQCGAYFDMTA